ncbi:MAG: bifunctional adenosylcobinamide kinase/adenosylcobinamide-phosphate guanylyltransferase [Anaerolineaceae bacterium]|nr:bifunctional adenosylcobinamide kinase/adenosylcobinamide-phosphate guanylyltransferase [Anaerolineaceae bacterium]
MGKKLTLILGGARSGKSYYAQQMVDRPPESVLYVATATAGDEEMAERIAAHKANRPAHWRTLEAPLNVGKDIQAAKPTHWVLLDCLTLLATNVLFSLPEPVKESDYQSAMDSEITGLLAVYQNSPAEWVLVSNEVGLGLVPEYPLGRLYRDVLGRANQRLAQAADAVIFMVAGLPMYVKGTGTGS